MKAVVVIATYNERDTIEIILEQLRDYQVVLVDDNSPDGTANIALRYPNVEVIVRTEERGIASAYRAGFLRALEHDPDWVVQMDAGLTHDPKTVDYMIDFCELYKPALLIGSRFMDLPKSEFKGYRTLISLTARAMMKFIHIDVSDATSGFRCWRADILRKVASTRNVAKGFAFQLENLYFANFYKKSNDHIYCIPIPYKLTNSSFKPKMLLEALLTYFYLFFWG